MWIAQIPDSFKSLIILSSMQEKFQLECKLQEAIEQFSQQSEYCTSMGAACGTLLWRVSRCEESIQAILVGVCTKAYMLAFVLNSKIMFFFLSSTIFSIQPEVRVLTILQKLSLQIWNANTDLQKSDLRFVKWNWKFIFKMIELQPSFLHFENDFWYVLLFLLPWQRQRPSIWLVGYYIFQWSFEVFRRNACTLHITNCYPMSVCRLCVCLCASVCFCMWVCIVCELCVHVCVSIVCLCRVHP